MINCQINYRTGGFHLTQIDECHAPETLAQRMSGGGFVICEDALWGCKRTIIVNLTDVTSIVLTHPTEEEA